MTRPILPTANELLGAAKLHLATIRPSTMPHLEKGRYAGVLEGFKCQEQLCLARVADEVASARVPTATGSALFELLQSEFDANLVDEQTRAIGEVALYRANPQTPGLIRAGTRFRRKGDKNASPSRQDAMYESTAPVYVGSQDGAVLSPVVVPVQAVQLGAIGNMPINVGETTDFFSTADALFDTSFKVLRANAAGGADNLDTKLRQIGPYLTQGQYGPNLAAIVAGLLSTPGVSRFAVSEDRALASVSAWIADDSWATSDRFRSLAMQTLQDKWLGWGCKLNLGIVNVFPVSVHATVVLRDKRYGGDTTEILSNIRKAIRSYFNGRLDWYTWTIEGIVAAIVRSDRRISCVKQTGQTRLCQVREAKTDTAIAEPSRELGTNTSVIKYHWHVDDTNIQVTFRTPSAT